MSKIVVNLNSNRVFGGQLKIVNSLGMQHGNGLSVLGKAAFNSAAEYGNPSANQLLLYGDTPTGIYSIKGITDGVYSNNVSSYGSNGVIKLTPVSGNAQTALNNGRSGFLIHGGDLDPGGKLRRTNGCLRLRNDELVYLKQMIFDLTLQGDPVDVVEIDDNGVGNNACSSIDSCIDGDPPPNF